MVHDIITTQKGADIHLWADQAEVEPSAMQQLYTTSQLPWIYPHMAVMPDVHWGMGATVGSVVPMIGAVAPAAVGVDIGCGMAAVRTNVRATGLPEDLGPLRSAVEQAIPVAHNGHSKMTDYAEKLSLFSEFTTLTPKVKDLLQKAMSQMGTLGGGNHFVELCIDEESRVWLFLHSGSRNIGKTLAEVHINTAKSLPHNADLPDRDLSVFLSGTPEMEAYRRDLFWAQRYAAANRKGMLIAYMRVLREFYPMVEFDSEINCHHTYVSEETHYGKEVLVTRKGAISAAKGQYGLIPGSMGTRSYVVVGKGDAESLHSASHGAGRRMSRNAAKKAFTVEDLIEQTEGVECRKDAGMVDEIPGAYKDIDDVIAKQSDLIGVVHTLKQVMCVKG